MIEKHGHQGSSVSGVEPLRDDQTAGSQDSALENRPGDWKISFLSVAGRRRIIVAGVLCGLQRRLTASWCVLRCVVFKVSRGAIVHDNDGLCDNVCHVKE